MQLRESLPFLRFKVSGFGVWAFDVFNVLLFSDICSWERIGSVDIVLFVHLEWAGSASWWHQGATLSNCFVIAALRWLQLRNADAIRFLERIALLFPCVFWVSFVLKSNLPMIFVFMSNRISFHWKSICFTMETNLKPWVILVSCSLLRRQSLNTTLLGDIRKRPPQVSYEAIVEALIEARHWFGWVVL